MELICIINIMYNAWLSGMILLLCKGFFIRKQRLACDSFFLIQKYFPHKEHKNPDLKKCRKQKINNHTQVLLNTTVPER